MKAVQHARFGPAAEVAECADLPEPGAPGGSDVLVEVLASPINPSDLLRLAGAYGTEGVRLPAPAGSQGVGRVAALGPDAQGLSEGELVLLHTYFVKTGVWREKLVAPANALIPVPDADPLQLSMLNVNPPTADLMLSQYVDLEPGDWVIQNAANSTVGLYTVVLAKQRGLKTINLVRRDEVMPAVRNAGGDEVLIEGPDLPERVAEITGGALPKLGIDAVAGISTERMAQSLAPGGTVVSYGLLSGQPCQIRAHDTIFRDIRIRGFFMQTFWETAPQAEQQALYARLGAMIADGTLAIPVEATYSLDRITEALTHMAGFGRDGKIFMVPEH
jgi:NADPH:quinone reductase-like Zn-dependent oxidoreductase